MSGVGVRLERVSLALGGRRVLRALDFDLPPGGHWLLLGANGAGKTQLLKLLAGERWPTPTRDARRTYRDARGTALALPDLLARIALVGGERQDKYLRYDWNFSVARVVTTGCRGTDRPLHRPTAAERARVSALLKRFDLERLRRRGFLTLSYGERRLTLLARALAARPRLLLLDEPFNGLDARARAVLDRELTRLARTRTTVVVSAHRADDVPPGFAHALVLERGRIAYAGPRAGAPPEWTREAVLPRVGGPRSRANPGTKDGRHAAARSGGQDRSAAATGTTAGRRREPVVAAAPLLVARGVALYRDYRPVLVDLDWTIEAGQHWALLGANGSGKTTLLRFALGDLPAALGAQVIRRDHPPGTHLEHWRRRIGFVSPELQAEYLDAVSVEELVVSGLHASFGLDQPPTPPERARARRALARVGLAARAATPFRELSYGQRRTGLIARALVGEPEALLLDEPLTGLDAPARARTRALLSRLARGGLQLVMAVHHPEDLVPEVRHALRLQDGRARTVMLRPRT